MSIASTVRDALAFTSYPVAQNLYTGAESRYFVFNYQTVPLAHADDSPDYERVLMQVHLYCPNTMNTMTLKKQVKDALENAGFTYPSSENVGDETAQHIVFECEGLTWRYSHLTG